MDAAEPLAIVLDPQEWNVVLAALSDAPWRVADPVIRKIAAQTTETKAVAPPSLKAVE